ncbi:MAG: TlpA family protein disulfide reductase [Planctomycetes bacterium]|nr:TlpA family protein disulfide reductase [Planctomycetota bacterium]
MSLHARSFALATLTALAAATLVPARSQAAPALPVQEPAATKLKIGDPAPALVVESFVKGTPVTALEKGRVYLIQFWAPWSPASVEQLVLLSEVQKTFADQGLVVLAVASTDVTGTTLEKVQAKLAEKGDALKIPVAWDKGSTTKDAFLKAAGRTQLPCAVIVDKEGRIAFVEDAQRGLRFLEDILAGQHDAAALTAWHAKAARRTQTKSSLDTAIQARKWAEVVPLCDDLLEVDPIEYGGYAQARVLAQWKSGAPDKAVAWARAWIEAAGKASPEGLNAVAWTLVDPADPFPSPDLDLAMRAAVRSAELTRHEDGAILDTLARVHFLKGDVAKAVEIQKRALVKLKPSQAQFKGQLEAALKEYEDALAKK